MRHKAAVGIVFSSLVLAGVCSGAGAGDLDLRLDKSPTPIQQPPGRESARATRPAEPDKPSPTASTGDKTVEPASKQQESWLAMGEKLAREAETNPAVNVNADGFVPWPKRRGPAYPGDFWRSVVRDAKEMPATLWDDTKATFTNKWAMAGFAAAIASGVAIDVANWNGCTADHYRKNRSQLNNFWDSVGDVGGNPGTHVAFAGAMYFTSLYRHDVKDYEVSKTLLNALAINGMATMALKGVAHSDSPNDDRFGWPSGHTSSTFCLATVMHKAYGPWVGVPLYAFATFVAYERVDARNHDLNDVVSGALIGIAIGYAVHQNHEPRILGMDVIPWVDPAKGSVGLALTKQW